MLRLALSKLPVIEEDDASGEVAEIYNEIKREMDVPFVPNIYKALAVSPAALRMISEIGRTLYARTTFPESLIAMVAYTIATKNECAYCAANNELTCRTLGIDEETLANLVEDLSSINPQRVSAIIEFVLKVAEDPKELTEEDYDHVRDQGVSDEEIAELIVLAGIGMFFDTVAEGLKIEVDSMVLDALGR